MSKLKHTRGFTLIELLVVISIIGLISSVVLASVTQARFKAYTVQINTGVKQYIIAMESYYLDNGTFPPTSPLNQFYCLGHGPCQYVYNSVTTAFTENNLLTNGLDPYIKNTPAIFTTPIQLSLDLMPKESQLALLQAPTYNGTYQGAVYDCADILANGTCDDAFIVWAVYGYSNTICGPGIRSYSDGVNTKCIYELK
jgi:prepilin-type N-terminal cleavage/methylation domain-containing protein